MPHVYAAAVTLSCHGTVCIAHLTALAPGTAPSYKAQNIQSCAHGAVRASHCHAASCPRPCPVPPPTLDITHEQPCPSLRTLSLKIPPGTCFASVHHIQEWVSNLHTAARCDYLHRCGANTISCCPRLCPHTPASNHRITSSSATTCCLTSVTTPSLKIYLKYIIYLYKIYKYILNMYLKHMHIPDGTVSTPGESINPPEPVQWHKPLVPSPFICCIYALHNFFQLYPRTASIHWLILCCFLHTPWF